MSFLSKKLWIFIALSCLLMHVTAQKLKKGPCIKVKPKKNFDANKFINLWFLYAKTASDIKDNTKCEQFEHYPPNGPIWPITHFWVDRNGIKFEYNTFSTITGRGVGITGPTGSNYTYLGTDYVNYAAVYTCKEIENDMHIETQWILTRSREPDDNTLTNAWSRLLNNDLPIEEVKKTDLSECPNNWDDAFISPVDNNNISPADGNNIYNITQYNL